MFTRPVVYCGGGDHAACKLYRNASRAASLTLQHLLAFATVRFPQCSHVHRRLGLNTFEPGLRIAFERGQEFGLHVATAHR